MKKYWKYFGLVLLILLISQSVLADAGAPSIISYEVIVINKDGAKCQDSDNKSLVPYGTVFNVYDEVYDNIIYVSSDDSTCYSLKKSDTAIKNDSFDVNNKEVVKLKQPVTALVLTKNGLNLRKGPAVPYSKIMTVPQYGVVTLKYKAGTFWYYAEYNGTTGWLTSNGNYLGYNNDKVLITTSKTTIYDKNNKVLGTIPALTEISNYLMFNDYGDNSLYSYYVNYNGIKGYIGELAEKVNGKLQILKDVSVYDNVFDGKVISSLHKNDEVEFIYSAGVNDEFWPYDFYYSLKSKGFAKVNLEEYNDENGQKVSPSAKLLKNDYIYKKSGYIGEGLFGEKINKSIVNVGTHYEEEYNTPEENIEENVQEIVNQEDKEKKPVSTTNLIIICLLGSIILALTIIIIILLLNKKKHNQKESVKMMKDHKKDDNVNNIQ